MLYAGIQIQAKTRLQKRSESEISFDKSKLQISSAQLFRNSSQLSSILQFFCTAQYEMSNIHDQGSFLVVVGAENQ